MVAKVIRRLRPPVPDLGGMRVHLNLLSNPPGKEKFVFKPPRRGPKKGPSAFLHPGRSPGFGCFPCPGFRLTTATDTFSNPGRDGSPDKSQSEPGLGLEDPEW